MNDEQFDERFDDLKQFIQATVSQSEARLEEKIGGLGDRLGGVENRLDRVENRLDNIEAEMHDGFGGIAEAIEALHQKIDDNYEETDRRLTALEQKAA